MAAGGDLGPGFADGADDREGPRGRRFRVCCNDDHDQQHIQQHIQQHERGHDPGRRHFDNDDARYGGGFPPFKPFGSLDGKASTGRMVEEMRMAARWGRACGTPFDAAGFLARHPQYDWLKGWMKDRPHLPWTEFP